MTGEVGGEDGCTCTHLVDGHGGPVELVHLGGHGAGCTLVLIRRLAALAGLGALGRYTLVPTGRRAGGGGCGVEPGDGGPAREEVAA